MRDKERRQGRILIVGGSMAGLFAAILLRKIGFQVKLFERSSASLESRGAGIVTHPELFSILAQAGIPVDPHALGVAVPGRRIFDCTGRITHEIDLPQVLTSWGQLYALLRVALPPAIIHEGTTLAHVEEAPDQVTAVFADGQKISGDLLIGADGLFSTVRRQLLPQVRPAYAGYVAWRGLVEETALSEPTRAALCNRFAFCLPTGEQMLGYPVSGPGDDVRPGHRRYNFVWYRPAGAEELGRLLTDTHNERHELSIPPNRIRPEVMAAMRQDADRLLAPPFAEVVRKTREPFLQAILDLEVPTMSPGARVTIIGDAAFVARPHVGAGVTKAAADADALAQALATCQGNMANALELFDRLRRPHAAAIVTRARELGAYMQAQALSDDERTLAEKHRKPEAVISETAVPMRTAHQ